MRRLRNILPFAAMILFGMACAELGATIAESRAHKRERERAGREQQAIRVAIAQQRFASTALDDLAECTAARLSPGRGFPRVLPLRTAPGREWPLPLAAPPGPPSGERAGTSKVVEP